MLRISTNTLYQAGITKISSLQSEQSKLQQQITTGRRILTPADDPVAAARALEITQTQSINSQYSDNRDAAKTQLNTLESVLSNVQNLLLSSKSSLVGAGNAALSDTERSYIANSLQNGLDELIGYANSKDPAGNYLFSGFQNQTAPYTATAAGATYNGDSGQLNIQVSTDRQMAVTETGETVFRANGNDLFNTLSNVIALLKTPVTNQTDANTLNTGLATANANIQKGLDNVSSVRASVGSKLAELDNLDNAGETRDLQYKETLSDLQDLDYAAALSDLMKQKTILEAAQQSYVATTGLSLFKYI